MLTFGKVSRISVGYVSSYEFVTWESMVKYVPVYADCNGMYITIIINRVLGLYGAVL